MRQFMTGVSLLTSAAVHAQTTTPAVPAAPPPPAATASIQERFDWATKAVEEGRCNDAVEQFTLLEQRPTVRNAALVRDSIAVRKGRCLLRLHREEEGEAAIRSGLPTLIAAGIQFENDVASARRALTSHYVRVLDYAGAQRELEALLNDEKDGNRAALLLNLAQVTAFDGGPEPLAHAQEAIDLIRKRSDAGRDELGFAHTVHARILLNQGRLDQGYAELKEALSLLGGLTASVTQTDITARSDLAIAAMLAGKPEEARQYLAYTGAGRMRNSPFTDATNMTAPDCDAADGLSKNDMAIIEFSISDDGLVLAAAPIYSTGGRNVAIAFAGAVTGWSWSAKDVEAIPAFFRAATRVELRCTTAGGRRIDLHGPLRDQFVKWVGKPSELKDNIDWRPILRSMAQTGSEKEQLFSLVWLGGMIAVPLDERLANLDKGAVLATKMNAPVATKTYIELNRLQTRRLKNKRFSMATQAHRALLAQPAVLADVTSATSLRLIIAAGKETPSSEAEKYIDAVISDTRLSDNDPLRVNALIEKASFAARRGDMTEAKANFDKTGLTEIQCAIIGTQPKRTKSGVTRDSLPKEALKWGFGGWVRTEFDILADGSTSKQRAIIAYPPFIFDDAAVNTSRDARFETSYRPTTGTACTASQTNVIFGIPR